MTRRDFWTEEALHIRTDRADWARYQASKAGQGFRMPHMPKRKWRGAKPVQAAPADPVADLQAEMAAFREEVKMQGDKIYRTIFVGFAVLVSIIVLGGSAVLILESMQ